MSKCRSSHQRCSVTKGILRNFAKFTRKHLCQSRFFNKVAGLRSISRNTFFTEHLQSTASVSSTYTPQKMLQNHIESNHRQILSRLTKTLTFWQYLTVFSHCGETATCSVIPSIFRYFNFKLSLKLEYCNVKQRKQG